MHDCYCDYEVCIQILIKAYNSCQQMLYALGTSKGKRKSNRFFKEIIVTQPGVEFF